MPLPLAHNGSMSDLQCAARFLVVTVTQRQADSLGDRLAGERIAAVYAEDGSPDVEPLSRRLGAASMLLPRPVKPESVVDREPDALTQLEELADLHRGETVLVLSQGSDDGNSVTVLIDGDGLTIEDAPGS